MLLHSIQVATLRLRVLIVARDMWRVELSVESQLPAKFTLWLSSMRMRRVFGTWKEDTYMRIIRVRRQSLGGVFYFSVERGNQAVQYKIGVSYVLVVNA